jgi:uncharacterized protein with HEPN domain
MQRDAKAYLWDISNAAESIRVFTDGKDLDAYLQDELLRAAVERKFGIIGEALSQLLRSFPLYRDRITLVGDIVAFRNQIVHGYATLRDDMGDCSGLFADVASRGWEAARRGGCSELIGSTSPEIAGRTSLRLASASG